MWLICLVSALIVSFSECCCALWVNYVYYTCIIVLAVFVPYQIGRMAAAVTSLWDMVSSCRHVPCRPFMYSHTNQHDTMCVSHFTAILYLFTCINNERLLNSSRHFSLHVYIFLTAGYSNMEGSCGDVYWLHHSLLYRHCLLCILRTVPVCVAIHHTVHDCTSVICTIECLFVVILNPLSVVWDGMDKVAKVCIYYTCY